MTSGCVKTCPDGKSPNANRVCPSCAGTNNLLNTMTNKCVAKCPALCKAVASDSTGDDITCDKNNIQYGSAVKMVCPTCKKLSASMPAGQQRNFLNAASGFCVSSCRETATALLVCALCVELYPSRPLWDKGKTPHICRACQDADGGTFWDSKCVESCPLARPASKPDRVCTTCTALNGGASPKKYWDGSDCVSACPGYTAIPIPGSDIWACLPADACGLYQRAEGSPGGLRCACKEGLAYKRELKECAPKQGNWRGLERVCEEEGRATSLHHEKCIPACPGLQEAVKGHCVCVPNAALFEEGCAERGVGDCPRT